MVQADVYKKDFLEERKDREAKHSQLEDEKERLTHEIGRLKNTIKDLEKKQPSQLTQSYESGGLGRTGRSTLIPIGTGAEARRRRRPTRQLLSASLDDYHGLAGQCTEVIANYTCKYIIVVTTIMHVIIYNAATKILAVF